MPLCLRINGVFKLISQFIPRIFTPPSEGFIVVILRLDRGHWTRVMSSGYVSSLISFNPCLMGVSDVQGMSNGGMLYGNDWGSASTDRAVRRDG